MKVELFQVEFTKCYLRFRIHLASRGFPSSLESNFLRSADGSSDKLNRGRNFERIERSAIINLDELDVVDFLGCWIGLSWAEDIAEEKVFSKQLRVWLHLKIEIVTKLNC